MHSVISHLLNKSDEATVPNCVENQLKTILHTICISERVWLNWATQRRMVHVKLLTYGYTLAWRNLRHLLTFAASPLLFAVLYASIVIRRCCNLHGETGTGTENLKLIMFK